MTIRNLPYETSILACLSYMLTLTIFPWIKPAINSWRDCNYCRICEKKQLKRCNFRHRNPFKHCNFRHAYKTKADEVNKILEEICGKKGIPLIWNNNINSKRHLNRTRLHLMTLRSQFWLGTLKLF